MNIFFILRKSYCFYQKKLITQTFQSANISTCQYWTSVESLHLAKFKVLPSFQTFYEYFKRFAVRLWKNSLPWNSLASSTSPSLSSTPDYSNDTTNNFKLINTWLGTVFPTTFKNTFEIWFFFQINVVRMWRQMSALNFSCIFSANIVTRWNGHRCTRFVLTKRKCQQVLEDIQVY